MSPGTPPFVRPARTVLTADGMISVTVEQEDRTTWVALRQVAPGGARQLLLRLRPFHAAELARAVDLAAQAAGVRR